MGKEKELQELQRIWVDGCFDFTHHGHAGALCQARALGKELYVGVHSDEAIAANKGPVVMHLPERVMAVEACRWVTKVVPGAPYVTDPAVMDEYGCWNVAHGDDITTDADGNDCYQLLKDIGRYLEFKRTPNISTTDLIQRMLSLSTAHHLPPLTSANSDHFLRKHDSLERMRMYSTDSSAKHAYAGVYAVVDALRIDELVAPSSANAQGLDKKVFYVDGGWDLFYTGHIEFLKTVHNRAQSEGAKVVVGVHDDTTVNQGRGENYPIMNIFERALCVLQCKYVDAIVLGAPFTITKPFLDALAAAHINVQRVFKGPAVVVSNRGRQEDRVDPYTYVKQQNMWEQLPASEYAQVRSQGIVERVLKHRRIFEERQRRKGAI